MRELGLNIILTGIIVSSQLLSGFCHAASDDSSPWQSTKSLPKDFIGYPRDSLLANARKIASQLSDKGEFESSEAHKKRIQAIEAKATDSNKEIVIVVPKRKTRFSYNADEQTGSIYVEPAAPNYDANEIELEYSSTASSYVGSNAYGAKAKVTITNSRSIGLYPENDTFRRPEFEAPEGSSGSFSIDSGRLASVDFTVNSSAARRIKETGTLAYVVKLRPPYFTTETLEFKPATFSNPNEGKHKSDTVYVDVIQVWLFNQKTGEFFAKFARAGEY